MTWGSRTTLIGDTFAGDTFARYLVLLNKALVLFRTNKYLSYWFTYIGKFLCL